MSKHLSRSPKNKISQNKLGGNRAIPNIQMNQGTDGQKEKHDKVNSRFCKLCFRKGLKTIPSHI